MSVEAGVPEVKSLQLTGIVGSGTGTKGGSSIATTPPCGGASISCSGNGAESLQMLERVHARNTKRVATAGLNEATGISCKVLKPKGKNVSGVLSFELPL